MASIIDALVVTLDLDTLLMKKGVQTAQQLQNQLTADIQQANAQRERSEADAARARERRDRDIDHSRRQVEQKTQRELADRGKETQEVYRKVRNEVVGLLTLFTAGRGVKGFVQDIIGGDAALGRFANQVGVSTRDLSAWEQAVQRTGGSAQAFDATVDGLSQAFQQYKLTGTSGLLPYMRQLGITFDQFVDKTGKFHPEQFVKAAGAAMHGMEPARARALGAGVGIDQGTLNFASQSRDAVDSQLSQMSRQGTVTPEDTKRAQELANAFQDVKQEVEDIVRGLVNDLSPTVTKLLSDVRNWLTENKPFIKETFEGGIKAGLEVGREFLTWLGLAKGGTEGLAGVTKPLVEDWKTFKGAIDDLKISWRELGEQIQPIIDAFKYVDNLTKRGGAAANQGLRSLGLGYLMGPEGAKPGEQGLGSTLNKAGSAIGGASNSANQWLRSMGMGRFMGPYGAGAAPANGNHPVRVDGVNERLDETNRRLQAISERFGASFSGSRQPPIGTGISAPETSSGGGFGGWLGRLFGVPAASAATNAPPPPPASLTAGGGAGGGGGGGPTNPIQTPGLDNPTQAARAKEAMDFFMSKGLNRNAAAGLTAQIKVESGFREGIWGDQNKQGQYEAYGILQWHKNRRDAISHGRGVQLEGSSYRQQLEAVYYEMNHGEKAAGDMIRRATSPYEAGSNASLMLVRPRDRLGNASVRGRLAEQYSRGHVESATPEDAPPLTDSIPSWFRHLPSLSPAERGARNGVGSVNSTQTNINGPITVHTQASDADGVARGLGNSMRRFNLIPQFNTGLA